MTVAGAAPTAKDVDVSGRPARYLREFALIPNCGHLPHVERPGEFAAFLGRFPDEHAPEA